MIQGEVEREDAGEEVRVERNRKRLRAGLIEPLLTSGLTRPKAMRQADFEVLKIKICDRLWWVPDHLLDVLVDTFERDAAGARRAEFPNVARANDLARDLAKAHGIDAPLDLPRIVTSFMASRAGHDAWARDPHDAMALFWYLNKYRRPPNNSRAQDDIADAKSHYDNRFRTVTGKEDLDDREKDWLNWYKERRDLVNHLIFGGDHA